MSDEIECRRCGKQLDNKHDEWFSHHWSREPPFEEIKQKMEQGKTGIDDYFSDGGVLCPSCHADFLVFLGINKKEK